MDDNPAARAQAERLISCSRCLWLARDPCHGGYCISCHVHKLAKVHWINRLGEGWESRGGCGMGSVWGADSSSLRHPGYASTKTVAQDEVVWMRKAVKWWLFNLDPSTNYDFNMLCRLVGKKSFEGCQTQWIMNHSGWLAQIFLSLVIIAGTRNLRGEKKVSVDNVL